MRDLAFFPPHPTFSRPARGLLVALALGLISCSPSQSTVIDGSTRETFAATTEQARRDLPVRDRLTFDTALNTIGGRRYANDDPLAMARRTFDGMTAADVVADAHARGIE